MAHAGHQGDTPGREWASIFYCSYAIRRFQSVGAGLLNAASEYALSETVAMRRLAKVLASVA